MKRRVFEEILQQEFRWPSKGDAPFVAAEGGYDNANLAEDGFTRLVGMTDGYKKAADIIVDQAEASPADRDFLVYPIVFNYRQFIELSLKYLIATYGAHVDVPANWQSHDLAILWGEFAKILDRFGSPDPDDADPITADIVAQFAKIDPGSYSYRYPVDKIGNPLPLSFTDLHLPTLKDVMNGVGNYFNGTDGYLSDIAGAGPY